MSGSAALEYGFPSTHSTNAVSVAVYVLTLLNSPDSTVSSHINLIFQCMTYLYVSSIVLGRLYCGMHGFLDVIVGCLLGASITFVQNLFGPLLDDYVFSASGKQIALVVLVIIILVRIHPEPADDCPCFDDSVAFAGVIIGVQLGCWHFAKSSIAWSDPSPATIPFRYKDLGLVKTVLRFVLGVFLIFTWREVMKPLLLRTLPPIFRALEKLGLLLPRRFFTRASQYKTVPAHLKDHEVLPSFAEIPSILTNIRHPRRRAISIGPQSEADAYETLAYREKRRREIAEDGGDTGNVSMSGTQPSKLTRKQSKLDEYEHMMGTGISRHSPDAIAVMDREPSTEPFPAYDEGKEPDLTEVFSQVKKPRVRYDVEVVTKLVVYSGLTSDTEMAGVFATQHLEKVYGSERQASVLPTEHAQSEIDNMLLDPMDTSSIKSSPAQQPETNAQSVGSNPPQNHVQSYSHLGPSFSNEMPRYVATIDDPYPWGPSLNSPFVRPRFAFSPKSRAASRIKSNPIAIAKPSANRTKQISFAAQNGSTLTGFNHTTRPFWNNRLVNDTSLLSSGVPSVANRGLAWTNFQKINMPSQGHPLKSDRSASVLSGFSSLPRKRSIDEDATSNPLQKVIDDSSNILIAPSAKYRRVDQKGSRLSPILPNVTAPDMAAGPQNGDGCGKADSEPTPTDSSDGNLFVHTGNTNPPVTSSPQDKAIDTLISEPRVQGITSESQGDIAQTTTQRAGGNFPAHSHFPPLFTRGPKPVEGPIRPFEVRDVIPQWHDRFPHNPIRIPGSWPEESHFDSIADVRQGCNDPLRVTPLPKPPALNGLASPEHTFGQQPTGSWQETFYNARNSTVGRVVRKVFSYAWSTVTRLFKPSGVSSRRTAAAVSTSPTRANLRNFPEQQRQQLKSHQWRKERGYPTVEHYPFPELSLDIPLYPAGAASQAESTAEVRGRSVSKKPSGTPRQPRKRIGTSGPRTVSLKERGKHGMEKRARVDSLSPRLKRRLLAGTRLSRWRNARRERALAHALETTEHDAVRPVQTSAQALSISPIESRRSTLIQPRATIEPKSKPKRVRFQEPLTETPTLTAPTLLTELAPHLTPPSPKIDRVAHRTEQIVEEKENVPPAPEAAKTVEHAARDDELRTRHDDWLRTEFPFGRPVSAVRLFYPVQKPLPPGRTESIYAAEWRKIEEEQKAKQKPVRVKPEGPAVRPLPPKWEAKVSEIKSMPNNRQIATTLSGDPLTKRDLATCYTPMAWLNDEIINSYLALIVDYLRRSHGNAGRHDKPRFHAFNTFFFSNLRDKGYQSVRRWATRAKIGGEALLNVDTVFIPVHNSAHWTLIVVKPGERTIEHFDSLGSLSRRHVGLVQGWLRAELASRYVEEEWTVLPSISPQQDNGSDCGVFLLSTAKAVAIGLEPLSYGAKDIGVLRRKIVAELMNGGLEGDFDPTSGGGEPLL
ncbi:hypothetical protein KXV27_000067 [Aspergillus fumigatus]|nr:hypothetical protein KXV27_000067 [Aspergillus fumigatus]